MPTHLNKALNASLMGGSSRVSEIEKLDVGLSELFNPRASASASASVGSNVKSHTLNPSTLDALFDPKATVSDGSDPDFYIQKEKGYLEATIDTLGIPQQLAYASFKNFGEIFSGELNNKSFYDDLSLAVSGDGKLSFNDVLKAYNLNALDPRLPEWISSNMQNPYIRLPVAGLAGLAVGMSTVNPFLGVAAAFGAEASLSGRKGIISGTADVALDPLNKIRILQLSRKGLDRAAKGSLKNSDSFLTQLASRDRNIFDFQATLGLGKWADNVSSNILRPVELVGEEAGRILNTPIVGPLGVGISNAFTGGVSKYMYPYLQRLFVKNGDLLQANLKTQTGIDGKAGQFSVENITSEILGGLENEYKEVALLLKSKALKSKSEPEKLTIVLEEIKNISNLKVSKKQELIESTLKNTYGNEGILKGIGASDLRRQSNEGGGGYSPITDYVSAPLDTNQKIVEHAFSDWETTKQILNLRKTPKGEQVGFGLVEREFEFSKQGQLNELVRKNQEITNSLHQDLVEARRVGDSDVVSKIEANLDTAYKGINETVNRIRSLKGGNAVQIEEKELTADLLEVMLGRENSEKLHLFYSDAGAQIRANTSPENAIAAQVISGNFAVEPNKELFLRMYRSASIEDGFTLLARHFYDQLKNDSQFSNGLKSILPKGASAEKFFVDNFFNGALFGKATNDAKVDGFFGTVIDGARSFLRFFKNLLLPKRFQSNSVGKQMYEFFTDADYFSKLDNNRVDSLLEIKDVNLKTLGRASLAKADYDIQTRLQHAGLLSGLQLKPTVQGYVRLPLKNSARSFGELERANTELGLLINSGDAGKSRSGFVNSPEYLNLLKVITDKKNREFLVDQTKVVSPEDYEAILKLGRVDPNTGKFVYEGNVNTITYPASQVGSAIAQIRSIFDIIPHSMFETNLAVLQDHIFSGIGKSDNGLIASIVNKVAISSSADLSERVKAALEANLDKVMLDENSVKSLADVLNSVKGKRLGTKQKELLLKLDKEIILERGLGNHEEVLALIAKRELQDGPKIIDEVLNLIAKPELDIEQLVKLKTYIHALSNSLPKSHQLTINSILNQWDAVGPEKISSTLTSGAIDRIFNSNVFKKLEEGSTIVRDEIDFEADTELGKILQEIEAKRGITPVIEDSVQHLPLTSRTLSDSRVYSPEQIRKEIPDWVVFDPKEIASLPPVIAQLRGKYIPKELERLLVGFDVNMSKRFEAVGKAFSRVTKGFEDSEALDKVNSTADNFERVFKIKVGDGTRNAGARALAGLNFDYLTSLFKSQVLLAPAFHIRNGISGILSNINFGVSVKNQGKALKDVINHRLSKETSPEFTEFLNAGGGGGGIAQDVRQEVKRFGSGALPRATTSVNPFSTNFGLYKANFAGSAFLEDALRFAPYLQKIQDGGTILEGVRFSKLVQLDYSALSATEEGIKKYLLPFYAFFRRSIFSRDPQLFLGKAGTTSKTFNVIEASQEMLEIPPEDNDFLASYISERFGMGVSKDPQTGKISYILLGGVLPAADILSLGLSSFKDTAEGAINLDVTSPIIKFVASQLQGLNPFLKVPVEVALNKSFFTGRDLESYEGQLIDVFGLPLEKRSNVTSFLKTIRILNEADKIRKAFSPQSTDPQKPLPSLSKQISSVLGFTLQENDPNRSRYFSITVPQKDARRNLKRQQKKGITNPNIPVAEKLLLEATNRSNQAYQKDNLIEQLNRGPVDDGLQRLFNTNNPNNLGIGL